MSGGAAGHELIHAEPFAYCAHPMAVVLPDGAWLLVFNRAPRRPFILHPPQDPWFHNVVMRSTDEGRSWSAPVVAPDFGWSGVECAGLTVLRSGEVLLNQWRFRWYPLPLARKLEGTVPLAFPREWVGELAGSIELDSGRAIAQPEALVPWARGLDDAYVHRSTDGGLTWGQTVRQDHAPFVGAYGMRGGVELADGTIVMPFTDVPTYETVFVLRSTDGGRGWQAPITAASLPDHLFEEPAPLVLADGRILMLCRDNVRHTLFATTSADGGLTWSRPTPTGIDGYPAHLMHTADGNILCTFGRRKPPFSIRAVTSDDGGLTWGQERTIRDLPNKDLGYPVTLPTADGFATFHYGQDEAGVTGIWLTRWSRR